MRVYIGPYISRWTSYLDEKWLEWRYKDNYSNVLQSAMTDVKKFRDERTKK